MRLLLQAPTGSGKTVLFGFLVKQYLSRSKRNVLILVHRSELIKQTEETLTELGIGCEIMIAKTRRLSHHSRVYIGMVETCNNRLRKNPYLFPNIGLLIIDECHILVFNKVINFFPGSKVLGCTATPVVMKRETFYKCKFCKLEFTDPSECCDEEMEEWSRPYTLSRLYEDIIVGPPISELVEFGSIVSEVSFVKHYTDDTQLKVDSDGEFVPETVEKEYGSANAAFNVLLNYEELCRGKKTLIFNASTKSNPLLLAKFKEAGYENTRLFDSVNKEESGSRSALLEWFAVTSDAVLINTGVFTTGFDSREVEAIIINRPTGSLSLFDQMAGRGARTSRLIYKPHFILVDGGGNIDRFGEWSSPERNWRKIFFDGLGKARAKTLNAEDIQSCPECGALYPKSSNECPECGFTIAPSPKRTQREGNDVNVPIRKIPPPNGERIYAYTKSQNEDINFAFRIMVNQIRDMFKYYRISHTSYTNSLKTGEFEKKTNNQIRKCYFVLLRKDDIQTRGKRTLSELLKRTKIEIDKYYETSRELHPAECGSLV